MLTLGDRLKAARRKRGLSQTAAADAVGIGNKSLSRYERGDSEPSPETIQKLCRFYDVSTEYVLGLTDVMGTSADSASRSGDSETIVGMTDHKASAKRLLDFIGTSPSRYHAIANITRRLSNEGFTELKEGEKWNLEKGGKYFVVRNLSTVAAFKIGSENPTSFNIISSHCDSPTFKIKPNAEMETLGHYIRLNTEKYGGMIMSTWMDRPLSVAGRVIVSEGNTLKTHLVAIDKDLLIIPNVAIHMQRKINDGFTFNPAVDMVPLMGSLNSKGELMKLIAENAGVKAKSIIGSDLFLYNRTKGTIWGNDGEYVSSPQLDDLQCAFGSLQGFLVGENPDTISMLSVFDNEEVGSGTKQGARSNFLKTVCERIAAGLGQDLNEMLPSSFVISADNAHAVHPNHPEYADPTHRPFMNQGIVIKYNGNEAYATDGMSEAVFKRVCKASGVPTQTFSNRSDLMGGSTLGNLSTSQLSVSTVDIGLPQLAMHSSYETAGSMDTLYFERASAEFYRTKLVASGDGEVVIK